MLHTIDSKKVVELIREEFNDFRRSEFNTFDFIHHYFHIQGLINFNYSLGLISFEECRELHEENYSYYDEYMR